MSDSLSEIADLIISSFYAVACVVLFFPLSQVQAVLFSSSVDDTLSRL
jgi:hypothetical protein